MGDRGGLRRSFLPVPGAGYARVPPLAESCRSLPGAWLGSRPRSRTKGPKRPKDRMLLHRNAGTPSRLHCTVMVCYLYFIRNVVHLALAMRSLYLAFAIVTNAVFYCIVSVFYVWAWQNQQPLKDSRKHRIIGVAHTYQGLVTIAFFLCVQCTQQAVFRVL